MVTWALLRLQVQETRSGKGHPECLPSGSKPFPRQDPEPGREVARAGLAPSPGGESPGQERSVAGDGYPG